MGGLEKECAEGAVIATTYSISGDVYLNWLFEPPPEPACRPSSDGGLQSMSSQLQYTTGGLRALVVFIPTTCS
jgi:hypothetical protein